MRCRARMGHGRRFTARQLREEAEAAIEEFAKHWPAAQRAEYSWTGGIYLLQAAGQAAKARDIVAAIRQFRQAMQLLDAAVDQPKQ